MNQDDEQPKGCAGGCAEIILVLFLLGFLLSMFKLFFL
jgi:hypothetical protein